MDYGEYLLSPHWKKMRQKRIEKDKGVCALCGAASNLQVHHLTYERLGAEGDADLLTLCASCHQRVHALNDHMASVLREGAEGFV